MKNGPGIRYALLDIAEAVSIKFDITHDALFGPGRAYEISHPRQIAMALAYEYTSRSLPQVGRYFHRHHATVLHAMKRVSQRCAASPIYAQAVAECRNIIANRGSRVEAMKAMAMTKGLQVAA